MAKAIDNLFAAPTHVGGTINHMISNVKGRSDALQTDIQVMLASCILHIMKHGDVTLANKANEVVAALSKGWRINAVRQYLVSNGPLNWDAEDQKLVYSKKKMDELKPKFDQDEQAFTKGLMSTNWYDLKPEAPFEGYSLIQKIMSAIKKAKKDLEDPNKKALIRDADQETIAKMESFVGQFQVTAKASA